MSSEAIRRIAAPALLALIVSCTSGSLGGDDTEGPSDGSLNVAVRTDTDNVLRAELQFTTATGGDVSIDVVDDEGEGFRLTPPAVEAGDSTVPLLGLHPDTEYTLEVAVGELTGSATFATEGLPADMPPIDVEVASGAMPPGFTLFNVIPFGGRDGSDGATEDGYLIAVDGSGEIVWYYRQTHSIQDVRQTADGELLFIHHETGVRSLDLIDGSLTEWSGTTGLDDAAEDEHGRPYAGAGAIRVETDQMHHEVVDLPNGNLLTLSRELREIDGFPDPLCDEDGDFSGTYRVVTDTIVEFAQDGSVVAEWSLFDMVDPLETLNVIKPAEFCSQYLEDVYPEREARDWTHANAVVLDEQRNALMVSVRHLDQVFAIRYQDDDSGPAGELMWRLGEGGDFELTAGEWFLHPHAPEVLDDGTIMIYDNGNERPGTSLDDPNGLPYSRAVQYRLDAENRTAEQVWEHRADSPGEAIYAPFVGDADMLDGGTVLITHGGLLDPPAHSPQVEGAIPWALILEVDYETGEEILDLRVKDPEGEAGWIVYRAERITTMYPPGYTISQIGR